MTYIPPQHRSHGIMLDKQTTEEECDPHLWRVITEIDTPPDKWQWTCVSCNKVVDDAPEGVTPQIGLRELEEMVDSSVRVADKVIEDDQSVKGELWIMRSALWIYYPFEFHIVYHVFHGAPFVLFFRYKFQKVYANSRWEDLRDTKAYRKCLVYADSVRSKLDPKVIV